MYRRTMYILYILSQRFVLNNVPGIQTSQDARFYGLSASFDQFSNEGKTLVVQFSVKHEQSIDCGGGYVKIFPSDVDQRTMHGDSPYNIMFGPSAFSSTMPSFHMKLSCHYCVC